MKTDPDFISRQLAKKYLTQVCPGALYVEEAPVREFEQAMHDLGTMPLEQWGLKYPQWWHASSSHEREEDDTPQDEFIYVVYEGLGLHQLFELKEVDLYTLCAGRVDEGRIDDAYRCVIHSFNIIWHRISGKFFYRLYYDDGCGLIRSKEKWASYGEAKAAGYQKLYNSYLLARNALAEKAGIGCRENPHYRPKMGTPLEPSPLLAQQPLPKEAEEIRASSCRTVRVVIQNRLCIFEMLDEQE
jgi:hypothetical protein